MYYEIKQFLLDMYDENYRISGFKASDISEYNSWKIETIQMLKRLIGLDKLKHCDFQAQVVEEKEFNYYNRKKIIIMTMPNVYMPFYLLTPLKTDKNAAVIALHGHSSGGKEGLVGDDNGDELLSEKIELYNYTYALDLVRIGYTVFCPDLCGFGERLEQLQRGENLESSCTDINNAAISLGTSLQGIIVHELICLISYISQAYKNIACCGFSGGGLSALWLAALDDRISCIGVSGYYHGFRDTILDNNLCGCNFVPDLWTHIDICDLGALIAPRYLLVESGKDDKLNGRRGILNVYEQVEITKRAYGLFSGSNFKHVVFDGGHRWNGSFCEFLKGWSESIV